MTPNIPQHVVSRRRGGAAKSKGGALAQNIMSNARAQRGSVDHRTVTLGLGLTAMIVVGILGFVYLHQVMTTAEEGNDIHELEAHIIELKERQKELELEGAQLRSLQAAEQRVEKLNLVSADKVTYLADERDHVAKAE